MLLQSCALRERVLKVIRHGTRRYGSDIVPNGGATKFSMRGDEEFRRFYDTQAFSCPDRPFKALKAIGVYGFYLDYGQNPFLEGDDVQFTPATAPIPRYDSPTARYQGSGHDVFSRASLGAFVDQAGAANSRGSTALAMNSDFSASRSRVSPESSL